MSLRKIFNYENLDESKIVCMQSDRKKLYDNSISAGGCLFYKINNNRLYLLLIKYADPNWPLLDDFGGQVDQNDITIFDTITRETTEETNNIITKDYLLDWIQNGETKSFYNKVSKYYLILIEANENFYNNTDIFGSVEFADNIKREIKWFDYLKNKNKLSHRLGKNPNLLKYLDSITTS